MAAPDDFDRVADLLGPFCEAASSSPPGDGLAPGEAHDGAHEPPSGVARRIGRLWPEVAGPEVAANAVPVHWRAGRLVVSTSSAVWANSLHYMAAELASRLNEHLGPGTVGEIVFRHAGWEERVKPSGVARDDARLDLEGEVGDGLLAAEQKKALDQVEDLDLPAEVKQAMMRAMRVSFVRARQSSVR